MSGDAAGGGRTRRGILGIGVALAATLAGQAWLGAAETSRAARRAAGADAGASDTAQFTKKLEQILSQQDEILKKLEAQHAEVMSELGIVKVRATRAGFRN
jgi:hypothetical protein